MLELKKIFPVQTANSKKKIFGPKTKKYFLGPNNEFPKT